MPIDFTKPVVTGNYSADILPPIKDAVSALARWLDPDTAGTLTGTPTGAFRLQASTTELSKFNGTSWASQGVNGLSLVSGVPTLAYSTTAKLQLGAVHDGGMRVGLNLTGAGTNIDVAYLNSSTWASFPGLLVTGLTGPTGAAGDLLLKARSDASRAVEIWTGATTPTRKFRVPGSGVITTDVGLSVTGDMTGSTIYRLAGSTQGVLGVGTGSGATALVAADDIVVDSSTNSGVSILSGLANFGYLVFGNSGGAALGGMVYSHGSDLLSLRAGGDTDIVEIEANAVRVNGTLRANGAAFGFFGIREGGAYGGAGPNSSSDGIVLEANGNTGISILTPNSATVALNFGDPESNVIGRLIYNHATGTMITVVEGTTALTVDSTSIDVAASRTLKMAGIDVGFKGAPRLASVATATAAAKGKVYRQTGNIAINDAVFAADDVFGIYNISASAITVTKGAGVTFRLAGTTTTPATVTIAPRGWASIYADAANEFVFSGPGVS